MTHKETKAEAIALCIAKVARHFDVDAVKLGSSVDARGQKMQIARQALYYHLHACGMSWRAIGKIWKRSVYSVEEGARVGFLRMDETDRFMLTSLPKIPTTLDISPVTAAPVTEAKTPDAGMPGNQPA
jgi:hypothetical protein